MLSTHNFDLNKKKIGSKVVKLMNSDFNVVKKTKQLGQKPRKKRNNEPQTTRKINLKKKNVGKTSGNAAIWRK